MQTENSTPFGYIYKITNKLNGKVYIGQTINIEKRFDKYKKLQCRRQPKLYNALKLYGIENFIFEILDTADDLSTLDFLEDIYVLCFDSIEHGYNCIPGGRSNRLSKESILKMSISLTGKRRSAESKLKQSISSSGKKRSLLAIQNISKCKKGNKNPNFGKHLSEETKQKMRETRALKNYKCSDENKIKASIRMLGDNNPMRKQKINKS